MIVFGFFMEIIPKFREWAEKIEKTYAKEKQVSLSPITLCVYQSGVHCENNLLCLPFTLQGSRNFCINGSHTTSFNAMQLT